MTGDTLFVGLEVRERIIIIAVADSGCDLPPRVHGDIGNDPAQLNGLMRRLEGTGKRLHFCYEATLHGDGLCRLVVAAGHRCLMLPSRLDATWPRETIERVRIDAAELARLARAHMQISGSPDSAAPDRAAPDCVRDAGNASRRAPPQTWLRTIRLGSHS